MKYEQKIFLFFLKIKWETVWSEFDKDTGNKEKKKQCEAMELCEYLYLGCEAVAKVRRAVGLSKWLNKMNYM